MTRKTRPFRELLLQRLANPTVAAHYLDAAMEESQESFLRALRSVAQARQMAKIAKETGVQRESLYRILSEQGNPTLETLRAIYEALGLKLATVAKQEEHIGPSGTPEIRQLARPAFLPIREGSASDAFSNWFSAGLAAKPTPILDGIVDIGDYKALKQGDQRRADSEMASGFLSQIVEKSEQQFEGQEALCK